MQTIHMIVGSEVSLHESNHPCPSEAGWNEDHQDKLENFKDPSSLFQQEATKIKYNATRVMIQAGDDTA